MASREQVQMLLYDTQQKQNKQKEKANAAKQPHIECIHLVLHTTNLPLPRDAYVAPSSWSACHRRTTAPTTCPAALSATYPPPSTSASDASATW